MSEEDKALTRKCDAGQLEIGDRLSRIQYYQVLEINEDSNGDRSYVVQNEAGFKFKVTSGIVEAEMFTANQFTTEEKVSRTELIEKLEGARDTCFTVVFERKLTDKLLADKLFDLSEIGLQTDRERRKYARELLKGTERRLVGYLMKAEPKMGRSMVVDLEVEPGRNNIRMVDHRTIKELIIRGVRYHC